MFWYLLRRGVTISVNKKFATTYSGKMIRALMILVEATLWRSVQTRKNKGAFGERRPPCDDPLMVKTIGSFAV